MDVVADSVRWKGNIEPERTSGCAMYAFTCTGKRGKYDSKDESGLIGVRGGQLGAEHYREESRQEPKKTEVGELIEDPLVEGRKEQPEDMGDCRLDDALRVQEVSGTPSDETNEVPGGVQSYSPRTWTRKESG